ncbi:MAG: metalloregulator ArsR/SmtB family transcription factor [Actinomycetota bacterium]|nr:metalloregulator ArsR/SmtB family transcription factor [Actinomycetota bacterium]MDH5223788.1 metalloregulator ArsR/SmtB family transcription factor [Actinomycetota bacterium]MDH5312839.1 metalloregulator ArsR/SmtB family transcription factor [Actinomycetota bacterium]
MGNEPTEVLDRVYGALADPARRSIVRRLAHGEATVGDVAAPLHMALPSVSKHIKVLERAGLIGRRVDGRRHYLHLEPQALRTAEEWLGFYRPFWEEGADKLAALVAELDEGERR